MFLIVLVMVGLGQRRKEKFAVKVSKKVRDINIKNIPGTRLGPGSPDRMLGGKVKCILYYTVKL